MLAGAACGGGAVFSDAPPGDWLSDGDGARLAARWTAEAISAVLDRGALAGCCCCWACAGGATTALAAVSVAAAAAWRAARSAARAAAADACASAAASAARWACARAVDVATIPGAGAAAAGGAAADAVAALESSARAEANARSAACCALAATPNLAARSGRTSRASASVSSTGSSCSSAVSDLSSYQERMGMALSGWKPNAWGVLSMMAVRDKSRPRTVKSFTYVPSTSRQLSKHRRWAKILRSASRISSSGLA